MNESCDMNKHSAYSRIGTIFFCVVLAELFLMGSGRLLEIGPLTLRMVLFASCLLLVFVSFAVGQLRISGFSLVLVLIYLLLLLLASLLGYLHRADSDLVFEDVKPLIYFLMLLFFEMMIRDASRIRLISSLVKILSTVMAMGYLVVVGLLYNGVIDFSYLYGVLSDSSEFMFRGEFALFFKGFLYLNIGLLFYLFGEGRQSRVLASIIAAAIVLTFTKGFIVALIPVVLIGTYLRSRSKFSLIPSALLLVIVVSVFSLGYSEIVGDKSESDAVRLATAREVADQVTVTSVFIGHGFGEGVPERPVHMETSFLEVFHKQGVIGVLFWIAILSFIIHYYRQAQQRGSGALALPFLLSSLFVYAQSLTNPFMNNPIGMSFLLVSLVSLRVLSFKSTTAL